MSLFFLPLRHSKSSAALLASTQFTSRTLLTFSTMSSSKSTLKFEPNSANQKALEQIQDVPLKISRELCSGKTYIVTGANVGLGMEAARHLTRIGASKVIMAVRNFEAGEKARADIEETTGTRGVAEVWPLDLSSYESVRSFASRAKGLERIDALIENAAIAGKAEDMAEEHSIPMTVNVLSTFYLALLLIPKLREDAQKYGSTPRLSIVTSGTSLDLEEFWKDISDDPITKMDQSKELRAKIYPVTKLMEILAVKHLANILPLERHNIIINAINPGLCITTLSRYAPQEFRTMIRKMWDAAGRTAEEGSRTLVAGAVGGQDSHGRSMDDCVPTTNTPEWIDDAASRQCWEAIAKELETIDSRVVQEALN